MAVIHAGGGGSSIWGGVSEDKENQMYSVDTQIKSARLNNSLEISGDGNKVAKLAQLIDDVSL